MTKVDDRQNISQTRPYLLEMTLKMFILIKKLDHGQNVGEKQRGVERHFHGSPGSIPVRSGQQVGGRVCRPTGHSQQDGCRDGSPTSGENQTGH